MNDNDKIIEWAKRTVDECAQKQREASNRFRMAERDLECLVRGRPSAMTVKRYIQSVGKDIFKVNQ